MYDDDLISYFLARNSPDIQLDLNGFNVKLSYEQYSAVVFSDYDYDQDSYFWNDSRIVNAAEDSQPITLALSKLNTFYSPEDFPLSKYLGGIDLAGQTSYGSALVEDLPGILDGLDGVDGVSTTGEWSWDGSENTLTWWSDYFYNSETEGLGAPISIALPDDINVTLEGNYTLKIV
jgi:hypothetical protein